MKISKFEKHAERDLSSEKLRVRTELVNLCVKFTRRLESVDLRTPFFACHLQNFFQPYVT